MFTLHSSIIDFKFYSPSTNNNNNNNKRKNMLAMQSDDEDEVESRTFVENGILVELKNADSIDTKSTQHHSASKHPQYKSLKTFQAHNMTEYLFFNDNGQPELSEESIA